MATTNTTRKANTMTTTEQKAKKWNDMQNEGHDGYNPYDVELADELEQRLADDDRQFAAEWTAEVTATRRAAWNAKARAGELTTFDAAGRQERNQGWTVASLKRAIDLHN